jgi:mono/diheme cytochrome c family protein
MSGFGDPSRRLPPLVRAAALAGGVLAALVLGAPGVAAQAPDGAALFRQHCRACHGAAGVPSQGMMTMFPGLKALSDTAFLAARSEDSIVSVLRHGVGKMKAFQDKLSPDEMAAVARFVKSLGSAAAGP